ncbi:MAG: PH domain-containing protein [Candidatus Beckwithbacteria bacterium]
MPDIFVAGDKEAKERLVNRMDVVAKELNLASNKDEGMGGRYITVAERLIKERGRGRIKTFSILPRLIRFETQEAREKVIILLRRHWITQIKWLVTAGLGVLVPLIFIWVPILNFLPENFRLMTVVMWYLLLIADIYESFITWYYHVFIVTDERIIDINFYNLIYKEVSSAKIDNIEDVTYRQGGVLRAMFNYGDVVIQTAAEKQEFVIECVPQPNRLVKILNELKLEEEHEKLMGRVR